MDTPFQGEKSPFLVPYPPPAQAPLGIKPFTAVDLAPPLGQGGPHFQAPQANPFLEKDFGKETGKGGPAPRPSAAPASLPDPLHPIPAHSLSQVFAPATPASSGGFPFASAPAPARKAAPAPITAVPVPAPAPVLPTVADYTAVPPAPAAPVASRPAPIIPIAIQPAPSDTPMASSGPVTSAALRASATPRRGAASEIIAKTDLAMTDADAPEPTPLIVTSGPSVEGRRISAYLGVVSSEIVIPMDVLFRNPAPYGELHRIKIAEEQLQRVKRKACEELDARARALDADGIVAVALQYSQIDAVAFLCAATGTAVKLYPDH
jgi:uncharacterized protein YbjQ (UPF0145 family)